MPKEGALSMLSLYNIATMNAALLLPLDPTVHRLLSDQIHDAVTSGLADLTHLLVVEENDTEADFVGEAAFSPFYNPLSETRYGDPGFSPIWCWADRLEDWGWIALHTVGDGGFAFIILVPDREGIDPKLLTMFREFIIPSEITYHAP